MGAMFQGLMKQAGDENWQGTRYRVTTIDDILSQANLSQIRAAIGGVSFLLLVLLFLVIVVGVANTFRLILFERIGEIGTLRALGVQRGGILALFLGEAFFLFVLGAAGGLAAAGLIMGGLALVPFAPNSPAFLLLHNGHLSFAPSAILIPEFVLVAAFVLLAAFFPARQAARLRPSQALAAIR
jgi:putative ABC transport system permease protein